MQHYWSVDGLHLQSSWITIGTFDGIHLGHQAIVRQLVDGARRDGSPSVVITFHPHPAVILKKRTHSFYLTNPDERAELLGDLGVDVVVSYPFTSQVAEMSAREFVDHLFSHLSFNKLIVGFNFALGKDRQGDVATLSRFGDEYGFSVQPVSPVTNGGEIVSSSQIRTDLAEGNVARVARFLGRPYRLSGAVVPGDGRGRLIGIPTANIAVWEERALPKAGVYVCIANALGQNWSSVANVGYRPTFVSAPVQPRVEAHLLDFGQNLYGETISLDFMQRLRDEQKFDSAEKLVGQIHQDITRTRQVFLESK
jgi:riboflavin kinase / FMN adenylyltransferase